MTSVEVEEIGLDEFVFTLDSSGRAVQMEAKVLGAANGTVVFKRKT